MTTEAIIANTKQMIDDLKTVCANFGLGNASSEYKIITEIFLYKFLMISLSMRYSRRMKSKKIPRMWSRH